MKKVSKGDETSSVPLEGHNPTENQSVASEVEDSRNGDTSDAEDVSDDDSPAGISWKESKEVIRQDELKRKEAVNFVLAKSKEKRQKRNEMFVSQKKAKLGKRSSSLTKLPEEIVLAVAKKHEMAKSKSSEITKDSSSEKVKRQKKSSRKRKKSKGKSDKHTSPSTCSVLVLKDEVNRTKNVQQSAAATFLDNHFYGNRLQRTSPSSSLTLQCKSFGIMKPAFKFSNQV